MNNKVNYTLIGVLVILSVSMMIAFGFWLLKPSDEKEMQKYNIHFDESVLGLNLDAPVKYRGINVGKVLKLSINPDNSEQVEVLISILKSTPIKSDTVAKLTSQGITGLSYINLSLGHSESPTLKLKEGEEYPIIKTIPSLFNKLEASFGSVSDHISTTLLKTQELLNDENQKQFSLLLDNTAASMYSVNNVLNAQNQKNITILLHRSASFMDKMNKLLDENTTNNFKQSMLNLNMATSKLNKMMPRIDKLLVNSMDWQDTISASFTSITSSYYNISSSMTEFKKAVQSGQFNIKDISSDLVPSMNNTFIEVQQLIIKLEEVLKQYERSPGDILFKQERIKKGPGEE